jgi:uncharacterized protein
MKSIPPEVYKEPVVLRSRRARALFAAVVVCLLIMIGFNYARTLRRQAPSRFYQAAIGGHTEEMAFLLDSHLVRLDQQPMGGGKRGYQHIRTLGEEAMVGSVGEPNVDKREIGSVRFLLDHGVSVNTRAEDGASILNKALIYHNPACAKLLIERGADVHLDDPYRFGSPLMAVADPNHKPGPEIVEVARLLLAKGVDVNLSDENGWTPLLCAAASNDADLVRELLAQGAQVNAQNHDGRTALIVATEGGYTGAYVEIVRLLLAHGADVTCGKGRFGNAMQAAKTRRATEIVRLLKQAAAKHEPPFINGH